MKFFKKIIKEWLAFVTLFFSEKKKWLVEFFKKHNVGVDKDGEKPFSDRCLERQTRAIESQTWYIKFSTGISLLSLFIALSVASYGQYNLGVSVKQLEKSTRPYLYIDSVDFLESTSSRAFLKVVLKNSGHAPARAIVFKSYFYYPLIGTTTDLLFEPRDLYVSPNDGGRELFVYWPGGDKDAKEKFVGFVKGCMDKGDNNDCFLRFFVKFNYSDVGEKGNRPYYFDSKIVFDEAVILNGRNENIRTEDIGAN